MADLNAYLNFLNYTGDRTPNLINLTRLHKLHLHKIPFENMSCIIGEEIQLEADWLFNKFVNRGRGGFCFENNGMFNWVLTQLGYQVRLVSAAVAAPTPTGFSYPLDHCLNLVTLSGGEQVLADVGFGKHTFTTPLPVKVAVHHTENGLFRLVAEEDGGVIIQKLMSDQWSNTCKIDMTTERELADFINQCIYHQKDESAYMAGNSLAVRYKEGGELCTMLGRSFRRYNIDEKKVDTKESKDDQTDTEINNLIREEFGIKLDSDIVPRRFDPSSFNI